MVSVKITGHGAGLLNKLRQTRKKYNQSENDDEMTEAYLREIHPLETQIIEEIFDAEDYDT